MRSCRGPTPRADRTPIPALEHAWPFLCDGRTRPLVDIAGEIVDAERAPAERVGPAGRPLPQAIEFDLRANARTHREGALVERLPRPIDDARVRVTDVAGCIRSRFFALACKRPLVL